MSSGLAEAFKHLAVKFYSFYCVNPAHLLFSYTQNVMFCCCYTFCWLLVTKVNFWFFPFLYVTCSPVFSLFWRILSVLFMIQLVLLNILDRKSCLQGRIYVFFFSLSLLFMLYCIGWDFWTCETVITTKEIFRGGLRVWPDVASVYLFMNYSVILSLGQTPYCILISQGSYVGYFQSRFLDPLWFSLPLPPQSQRALCSLLSFLKGWSPA